jgi:hypothetical protein
LKNVTRLKRPNSVSRNGLRKSVFYSFVVGQDVKNAKLPSALIEGNLREIGVVMRGAEAGWAEPAPAMSRDIMEKVPLDKPTWVALGCGFHDPKGQHWIA